LGSYGDFYWKHLIEYPKPFIFLDIGANQGLYSIGSQKNPRVLATFSVEPVKITNDFLKKNIAINGLSDKVKIGQFAISSSNDIVNITVMKDHSGASTLRSVDSQTISGIQESIACINRTGLSEFVGYTNVEVLVKIDVEGLEEVVIEEVLNSKFGPKVAEIYFEVDENWINLQGTLDKLFKEGFIEFQKIGQGHHYDILAAR